MLDTFSIDNYLRHCVNLADIHLLKDWWVKRRMSKSPQSNRGSMRLMISGWNLVFHYVRVPPLTRLLALLLGPMFTALRQVGMPQHGQITNSKWIRKTVGWQVTFFFFQKQKYE